MPSTSEKQRVAMAIACHEPGKSTSGIPQDVACEFNKADAKKNKAKKKVKEAVEYLETLKMIETVRSMSFTEFLVEDATKKAPNAGDLIASIQQEAMQAAESGSPRGMTYLQRVKTALQEIRPDLRLMGAMRARDAYNMSTENDASFEDAESLISLTEAVEIPDDASFEQVEKMYKAAVRGRQLADKLKKPEDKKKHKSRTTGNWNKIRAKYMKMKAAKEKQTSESVTLEDLAILEEAKKKHKKKKKPSAGLTKKEKSSVVKKAKKGKDVFGGGFEKVKKAAKKGGAKDPEAVAAAQMWKMKAAKAKHENMDLSADEVDFIVESTLVYQKMMKKLNDVFTEYLDPEHYDNQKVIIETAMKHADEMVYGWEVFTEEEQMELIKDTCVKYDICEAFGDNEFADVPPGDDDMEMNHPGADYEIGDEPQQIGGPASKTAFKLEPAEIGQLAELIAQHTDFPPENKMVARAVEKLQYADLFHLTPEEAIMARKILAMGGEGV